MYPLGSESSPYYLVALYLLRYSPTFAWHGSRKLDFRFWAFYEVRIGPKPFTWFIPEICSCYMETTGETVQDCLNGERRKYQA